jgi:hypothetical protein
MNHAHLGRIVPREYGGVFDENERATLSLVIARLDRATQYSRGAVNKSRGRGVLDRPVKPDDDNFLWRSDLSTVAQRATASAEARRAKAEGGSDEAIHSSLVASWIASRSLSSGAHSRDPLARK